MLWDIISIYKYHKPTFLELYAPTDLIMGPKTPTGLHDVIPFSQGPLRLALVAMRPMHGSGGWATPLKNMKVSWDDDYTQIYGKIIQMFQTTNQCIYVYIHGNNMVKIPIYGKS